MSAQVVMRLACDAVGCGRTVQTVGAVEAYVRDGGRVEVELRPEYPAGWGWRRFGDDLCPEHVEVKP